MSNEPIRGASSLISQANLKTHPQAAVSPKALLIGKGLPSAIITLIEKNGIIRDSQIPILESFSKKLGFQNLEHFRDFLALQGFASFAEGIKAYLGGKFKNLELFLKYSEQLKPVLNSLPLDAEQRNSLRYVSSSSSAHGLLVALSLDKESGYILLDQLQQKRPLSEIRDTLHANKTHILQTAKARAQVFYFSLAASFRDISNRYIAKTRRISLIKADSIVARDYQARLTQACQLSQKAGDFSLRSLQTLAGALQKKYDNSMFYPVDGRYMTRRVNSDQVLFGVGHKGMDYQMDKATPIRANFDGEVIARDYSTNGGYMLTLKARHQGETYVIKMLHLPNQYLVNVGDKIFKGQIIALSGNTGKYTTGPHLHYQIEKNGKTLDIARLKGIPSNDFANVQRIANTVTEITRIAQSNSDW